MNISDLIELGCAKVGSLMKGKRIDELRKLFEITNDFTPEEEKSILEGKADIWGDENEEGEEPGEIITHSKEEVKFSK